MDEKNFLPKDAEAYMHCFRMLAALLHKAMDEIERAHYAPDEKARTIKRVEDGVNTIANLRGDSSIFYAARPTGLTEFQSEMYRLEDELQSRLQRLRIV